jgi:hypothetical protein
MLATALDTDLPTGTSQRSPANYVLSGYTSVKKALNQMLYLIAICIILRAMYEARKLNVNYN